jgi:hypothetical protein
VKETKRIEFKKINDWFVILETNIMREFLKSFAQELVLLLFEDIRDIELLQLLIGKIDEKLLKWVNAQHFKAEYVKQSNTLSEWFIGLIQVDLLQFNLLIQFDHNEEECFLI